MLGPLERAEVQRLIEALQLIRAKLDRAGQVQAATQLLDVAERLRALAAGSNPRGRLRNPYVVTYGNPPLPVRSSVGGPGARLRGRITGVIAHTMHTVTYEHERDGKPYEHAFDTRVLMYAAELDDGRKVAVLIGSDGQPVVEDV